MNLSSFFDEVEQHFQSRLPFVIYRKPNSMQFKAWLKANSSLDYSDEFKEEGFVFAPYGDEPAVILKKADCHCLSATQRLSSVQLTTTENSDLTPEIKNAYKLLVARAISEITSTALSKVVVSRVLSVEYSGRSPVAIFNDLIDAYPNAFVYCWFHPKVGLWLGATPELLLSLKRNQLKTVSLAGTLNASDHAEWSPKELHEQQIVTDFIVSQLQAFSTNVESEKAIEVRAGRLRHLKSEIKATLNVQKADLNSIIAQLHPTPAVCGFPKDLAKVFIAENEEYSRSYYTGFLGEINCIAEQSRTSTGRNAEHKAFKARIKESQLYVNLRCMQLIGDSAKVYAGGGIVASSDPEKEWQETVDKARTMMQVL